MYSRADSDLVTETSPLRRKGSGILMVMSVPRVTVTRRVLSALAFVLIPAACAATGDQTDLGLGTNATGRESPWPDGGAPGNDSNPDDGSTSSAEGSASSPEGSMNQPVGDSGDAVCGDPGQ